MNIKEHIEAGHYPVDKLGFPLVERLAGDVHILSTSGPKPEYVIVGRAADGSGIKGWDAEGNPHLGFDPAGARLLPPPPRKVKVTRWAVLSKDGDCLSTWPTRASAHEEAVACRPATQIVELTGEYEEPWDK